MAIIQGATARIVSKELTFTEDGAGTYTGTVAVPAGATVLDVQVHAVALWAAATSASLEVGDATDADGFWTAVNLKATDLLAGEGLTFAARGSTEAGAYLPSGHVLSTYSAAARTITATVVSVGAGTTGRTRVLVIYCDPGDVAATKA